MARAISEPNVTAVNIYFPGGARELWYDVENTLLYTGNGYASVSVTLDSVSSRLLHHKVTLFVRVSNTVKKNLNFIHNDRYSMHLYVNSVSSA